MRPASRQALPLCCRYLAMSTVGRHPAIDPHAVPDAIQRITCSSVLRRYRPPGLLQVPREPLFVRLAFWPGTETNGRQKA